METSDEFAAWEKKEVYLDKMKAIWISGSTSSSYPRLSLQGSVGGNGVFLGPEYFLCKCVHRDAEAIRGSTSMAVSINNENKLLPGRIARACYCITAGTYSHGNAGQDTWNTLSTVRQSHSHRKIARVNKDKWKKGLENPDLPISEIINLILHPSVQNWHKYQLMSLKSLHNMQVPISPHWGKGKAKIYFPTFIVVIISLQN